jgi:hypothetical protein
MMALTVFNAMSSPAGRRTTRIRLATALHASETKARDDPRRAPADAAFLRELAERLAVAARLPIEQAQRRVQALAITAPRPRERWIKPH